MNTWWNNIDSSFWAIQIKRQMEYMNWIYLVYYSSLIDHFPNATWDENYVIQFLQFSVFFFFYYKKRVSLDEKKNSDKFSIGCKQMPDKNDLLSAGYCSPKTTIPKSILPVLCSVYVGPIFLFYFLLSLSLHLCILPSIYSVSIFKSWAKRMKRDRRSVP